MNPSCYCRSSAGRISTRRNPTVPRRQFVDLEAEALTITAEEAIGLTSDLRSSSYEQGAVL